MKGRFCWIVFIFVSFASSGQSESDSVFLFDVRFNYSPDSNARWISQKTHYYDNFYFVETGHLDTSNNFTRSFLDKYTQLSEKKLQIDRSYWRRGKAQPGLYLLDVTVVNKIDSLFEIDLFSKELNIHQTVFSKTLIPICPIEKTIFYHPNCEVARIYYHASKLDTLWNSDGELMDNVIFFEEMVDSMPVIANNEGESFKWSLSRIIRESINYPLEAREANIAGRVYVTCIITKSGKIEQIEVMIGGVHPLINNAAMDIFRNLEIARPALINGDPIDFSLRYPISFHVH